MARQNVMEKSRPLPHQLGQRLAELVRLGKFDQVRVAWCRRDCRGGRDDWHKTLIDCCSTALARSPT